MPNPRSILALFGIIAAGLIGLVMLSSEHKNTLVSKISSIPALSQVLGGSRGYNDPRIVISGTKENYQAGGVISITSTDDPSILIEGNNIGGTADVSVYEANEDLLFAYLTHDNDWKQTKKTVDVSSLRFLTTIQHAIRPRGNDEARLLLPIGETGIWLIRVKLGSVSQDGFVIRSDTGVLVKEGDNELIFWAQNFKTKRSVTGGSVTLYNLKDEKKELGKTDFSNEGIARFPVDPDIDIAFARFESDVALVPVNLHYLNSGNYSQFNRKIKISKYFVFTDRPIYKPGDTVYYKAVIRNDDDARYSLPTGFANVKAYKDWDEKQAFFDKNIAVTGDGTVYGRVELPKDAETGYYNLNVKLPDDGTSRGWFDGGGWGENTIGFQVENYRKPEYGIDITVPKTEYIAGDSIPVTISGNYFSGHPLSGAVVSYTVTSSDYYDYEYAMDKQYIGISDDYRFGGWGGNQIKKDSVTLNDQGSATAYLTIAGALAAPKLRVVSIEAQFTDGSGNPSVARKNILLYPGLFGIYRKQYGGWSVKTGTPAVLDVVLTGYNSTETVPSTQLTARIHRENWVSYQEAGNKYPSYRQETEELPQLTGVSDRNGFASFRFTPQKPGSYRVTVTGKDVKGNVVEKDFYIWVSSEDQPYYANQDPGGITIQGDKGKYDPGETAEFTVLSDIPDRDVFLSFDRARVNRFRIIRMHGKSAVITLPVERTDMPNIFVSVASFSQAYLDEHSIDVKVRTDSKKLHVSLAPNRSTYAPGDTVVVNVETKDVKGNPVSADTAVWAIDKALFELVDERPEKIFDRYWSDRYNNTQSSHSLLGITVYGAEGGGGCFAPGTRIAMADGSVQPIEKILAGDRIRTRKSESDPTEVSARVLRVSETANEGYLIINTALKITADHKVFVNGIWKTAGDIQTGDDLTGPGGRIIKVTSVEWRSEKTPVYNLEVDGNHTFIAENIWVHNQKGGGARSIFKDTAYWNPSVHTGSDGRAQVSFKLPDNLTTWVISTVGSTNDTKVGQYKKDIVVTKDVIVRPVIPNILRVGDVLRLSALIHNHTDLDHLFDLSMTFESGSVSDSVKKGISIAKNNLEQLFWDVDVNKTNGKAKLTVAAKPADAGKSGDTITETVPVIPFGFTDTQAFTGDGSADFPVRLFRDTDTELSRITLSLAPSQFGTLPQAMQYLVGYPYGCVEQTTSSFVPSVIARANTDVFPELLKDKNLDDILAKGIKRLALLQKSDGGWTWWYSGNSDAYITSYVVEYLLMAKKTGATVDAGMLDQARAYLERETTFNSVINPGSESAYRDDRIIKTYILSLLGSPKGKDQLTYFSSRSADVDPDILSMAILANTANGNKNPDTNGLTTLMAMMKTQGDSVYWQAGRTVHFGSIDASTAFALRAIIAAGGDRNIAAKAARFLTKNRKNQYWSNTYATAQVVRAMTDFVRTGNEATPDYSYSVTLDGSVIAKGEVKSAKQIIPDVTIAAGKINKSGSVISVQKSGEGQLYSTLIQREFRTDVKAKESAKGLVITREYVNDKGDEYSIGTGDTVVVKLTVSGLGAEQMYGLIEDELPAGLIPINTALNNEQAGTENYSYYTSYNASDMEVTLNGVRMSLYKIGTGARTYTYKARAIADGTFLAPPASVGLMYSPEVYGRSMSDRVVIHPVSKVIPEKLLKKTIEKQVRSFSLDYQAVGYFLLGISAGGLILFGLRKRNIIADINAISSRVFSLFGKKQGMRHDKEQHPPGL